MRKKLFAALVLTLPAVMAFSQGKPAPTVPQPVRTHFSQQYSQVSKVDWVILKDDSYQAAFNQSGITRTVVYQRSGQWVSTQEPIAQRELPLQVARSLQSQFAGYSIGQVSRLERFNQGRGFRIRVSKDGGSWDVELDTGGVIRERVVVVERDSHGECHHHKHKHKKHHHHGDDDEDDD